MKSIFKFLSFFRILYIIFWKYFLQYDKALNLQYFIPSVYKLDICTLTDYLTLNYYYYIIIYNK